ncbi:MAG: phage terminase large subunit [Lachnospiraceae bacterium]|nr:phage terminase large subunit [Lachnospiraceae bacterium]
MSSLAEQFRAQLNNRDTDRERNLAKGRKDLRTFCSLRKPDFYKPEREYQDVLCNTLQAAYEKKLLSEKTGKPVKYLIINLPPGFGKSYTLANFVNWVYGQDIKNKVITVSYNGIIAPEFSRTAKDMILEEETEGEDSYTTRSFFPSLKVKYGDSSVMKWSLEGSYTSYLATSFDGTLTGMRGNIIIIDDPIKSAEEAVNENVKEKHWNFFKNTLSSRMLPGALCIIVLTRWATDDLAGRVMDKFPDQCYELKIPALTEDSLEGVSTCEDLYPTEDLQNKRKTLDEEIWGANYMQVPVDKKGALYGGFKTYDAVDPDKFERVLNYTDTADEGNDFLGSISGGTMGRYLYVTDIYYTDEPMEATEPELARRLQLNGVRECLIESNNGGRGFARNVIRHLKELKCFKCSVTWFHQSKNKKTRIITNASNVMEQVVMPHDWEGRWPEAAAHIKRYQRKGKNDHDDIEDTLTGIVEFVNGDVKGKKKARVGKKSRLGI